MFERVRESFRELLASAPPGERRGIIAQMKDTLVHARLGLDDLRTGAAKTRARVEAERRELETVRRRRKLAIDIGDQETVTIADRFEKQHAERLAAIEKKLEGEEEELALVEREVEEMTREMKAAAAGASVGPGMTPASGSAAAADPLAGETGAELGEEIDGLGRARRRAEREATAEAQLEALKRRMGK